MATRIIQSVQYIIRAINGKCCRKKDEMPSVEIQLAVSVGLRKIRTSGSLVFWCSLNSLSYRFNGSQDKKEV